MHTKCEENVAFRSQGFVGRERNHPALPLPKVPGAVWLSGPGAKRAECQLCPGCTQGASAHRRSTWKASVIKLCLVKLGEHPGFFFFFLKDIHQLFQVYLVVFKMAL